MRFWTRVILTTCGLVVTWPLTFDLLTSKSNQFNSVANCTKVVNLARFLRAVRKTSRSQAFSIWSRTHGQLPSTGRRWRQIHKKTGTNNDANWVLNMWSGHGRGHEEHALNPPNPCPAGRITGLSRSQKNRRAYEGQIRRLFFSLNRKTVYILGDICNPVKRNRSDLRNFALYQRLCRWTSPWDFGLPDPCPCPVQLCSTSSGGKVLRQEVIHSVVMLRLR